MTGVLQSFLLFLSIAFLAYIVLILVPFLRHRPIAPGDAHDFDFHIFVPCRDEEVVIAATIHRARTDFPSAHLWVIDDDSDDATSDIATAAARRDDHVHLVQRRRPNARTGKGDALNAAFRALEAWLPPDCARDDVIVVVVDADGEMAPDALDVCASDEVFGDARVGAAQIAVWMRNRADRRPYPDRGWFPNAVARWLVRMQDLEFRTVIAGMQSLRARTSTVGLGGNGQFTRLSALDSIADAHGEPWHGALLEDYELGVHVLLAGWTVRHVYDTHVSQEALPSLRRLLTQRTRWAQGNIQCIRYVPQIVGSPHIDSGGVVETCYYLLLPFIQILGCLAYLVVTARIVATSLTTPATEPSLIAVVLIVVLVVLFGIAPFALWGPIYKLRCEPTTSWPRAILYGLGAWIYVYYMYVCIARAFWRIARGKNGWSKTRRNAESHVTVRGSVAIEE